MGTVASTSSIYYKKVGNVPTQLQMAIKSCVPAESLLARVKKP